MKTIKADLSNEGCLDILERVKAYRGGKKILITSCYLHSNYIRIYSRGSRCSLKYSTLDSWIIQDRRKIEHEAFSGQLLGIIATNALELGIDIGVLDAVIMLGFPMTISNFVGFAFVQIVGSSNLALSWILIETTSRKSREAGPRFSCNLGCRSLPN